MAGDQAVLGLAVMAELTGKSIAETGTTIYRPPYSPTQPPCRPVSGT